MKTVSLALCILLISIMARAQVELSPSDDVRLVLKQAKFIPDKKGKTLTIQAVVASFLDGKQFTDLSVSIFQDRSFSTSNLGEPSGKWCKQSQMVVIPLDPNISNLLEDKHEAAKGKGYCWGLPPDFMAANCQSNYVVLVSQRNFHKEVLGVGGLAVTKIPFQPTETVQERILAAVWCWMKENF